MNDTITDQMAEFHAQPETETPAVEPTPKEGEFTQPKEVTEDEPRQM